MAQQALATTSALLRCILFLGISTPQQTPMRPLFPYAIATFILPTDGAVDEKEPGKQRNRKELLPAPPAALWRGQLKRQRQWVDLRVPALRPQSQGRLAPNRLHFAAQSLRPASAGGSCARRCLPLQAWGKGRSPSDATRQEFHEHQSNGDLQPLSRIGQPPRRGRRGRGHGVTVAEKKAPGQTRDHYFQDKLA